MHVSVDTGMHTRTLELMDFFFEAAIATYVTGTVKKTTIPGLPGSKGYTYPRGEYLYIDSYGTNGEKSGGQTLIYVDHGQTLAWMMHYKGWCKNDDPEVIAYLKKILAKAYAEKKFYGGRGAQFPELSDPEINDLQYTNRWSGTFENFSGREEITRDYYDPDAVLVTDTREVFWHRFDGMLMLP